MKNSKGEMSVELIVTVIVLIIICGVCIFMLTGENGLFVPKGSQNNAVNQTEQNNTGNEQKNNENSSNETLNNQTDASNENALVVETLS